ncbi:hypothetical protein Tco_0577809 [Tanacetum coccineum]
MDHSGDLCIGLSGIKRNACERTRYPLPRIDDLFDQLQGSSVYLKIDLRLGYHQLTVREEDILKTAFRLFGAITNFKLCVWFDKHPAVFMDLRIGHQSLPYWGSTDFIGYTAIASKKGLGAVLMQREKDLKAQLQDKDIAISELKKLIEKNKGKGVDTNFEKQSILGKPPLQPIRNQPVVRQPTAYKSERSQLPRHRIASQVGVSHDLTKPVTPHSWPQVRKSSFAKPYDVNAPGPSRNSPKHVSFQSPRESVGSNDMVHNYYLEEAKKKAQLQKDKALNTKPSVQQSARLPNTANGNKPKPRNFNQQPRNWPPSMSSRVSNRTVNIAEPPRNQKTFLKSKDLACPTCKKCIYSANHDECILKYLSKVHSRASTQKKDAQSHKTTKRYMPVEKKCDSKKHDRHIPIVKKFSPNKSSNMYLKIMPPRSGLTWKPTGRIFTQVGLKWIPIRKPVETRYNTNYSASPLGKETHNPKTIIRANFSSLSAGNSMAFKPISSNGSSNVNILSSSSLYKHSIFNYVRKYF